jgi:hypothetical protein
MSDTKLYRLTGGKAKELTGESAEHGVRPYPPEA